MEAIGGHLTLGGAAAVLGGIAMAGVVAGRLARQNKTSNKALKLVSELLAKVPANQLTDAGSQSVTNLLCAAPTHSGRHLRMLYAGLRRVATPAQLNACNAALTQAGRLQLVQ